MLNMLVTLDVSKLSSWLKADAEPNIKRMSVTRDVSKLSGWLKADANQNMPRMFVTRDVSQLEMSALKFCKRAKSSLMSVMGETFQPAMAPCVAMAAVWLASYSWTAACRSALVVKMVAAVPRMFMASMLPVVPVVVRGGDLTLVGASIHAGGK